MKSKILSLFASIAFIAVLAACDDHQYGGDSQSRGQLSFADFGVEVENSQTVIESRATVDVSDFIVKIINKRTQAVVKQSSYAELPEVIDLPVGDYTISVESHQVAKADWDCPYYAGSGDVTITENKISNAGSITCRFSSIRVTIKYAEHMRPLMGDDVKVTVLVNDYGQLVYTPDEQRSGYFEAVADSHTMIVTITGTINGTAMRSQREFTQVKPGEHYIITFKVGPIPDVPGENGSITPGEGGITIDTSVERIDTDGNITIEEDNLGSSDRPGQEEPEEPENPDKPDQPNPPVEEGDVKMDSELEFGVPTPTTTDKSGIVYIHADSGLKNLYLNVVSTNEEFAGIALSMFGSGNFDIANPPSTDSEETLTGLGLDCGDKIRGEVDVKFDISQFIPMLNGFQGEHTFKLTVVSNGGSEKSESLIFIAE